MNSDLMKGFFVGKALGIRRYAEPVAYLYNGVEVPIHPDYDEEAYPYAFILRRKYYSGESTQASVGDFCLAASVEQATVSNLMYVGAGSGIKTYYLIAPQSWTSLEEGSIALYDMSDEPTVLGGTSTWELIWANHDVYYADVESNGSLAGTLYLGASEPIPVYE